MVENDLGKIVGNENVMNDPDILKEYSGGFTVPIKSPKYVVRPANIDELQGIVRWANEKKIPLVPVSSGPPHFRGDTVPGVEDAVIGIIRQRCLVVQGHDRRPGKDVAEVFVGVLREPVVLGDGDLLLTDYRFLGTGHHRYQCHQQNSDHCEIKQLLHFSNSSSF